MRQSLHRGTPGVGRGARGSVAIFSMLEASHLQRLLPLIAGLARCGLTVNVYTHRRFRASVEHAGGIFVDLFTPYPLEGADDESIPFGSRYVTFAGTYAEEIRRDVEKTRPSVVIHDTFAVIGRVIAASLGLPRVNVCAGHNLVPARYLAELPKNPLLRTSARCLAAVARLRDSYGLEDASPFSHVAGISPQLNIYCEPPEFLDERQRVPFEPIAFYGSLSSLEEGEVRARGQRRTFRPGGERRLSVYVSFGTVVWRYYTAQALSALSALSAAFAGMERVRAVISLGNALLDPEAAAALNRPNVVVRSYVDQWKVLGEVDAFVTHHGLNSTHEAIFHRVPMVSYPFFWDQPELAALCQRFGLAIPLAETLLGELDVERVRAAMAALEREREAMNASLARARSWELAVIAGREAVHRRIATLMG